MFCSFAAARSAGERLRTQLKTKNITVSTIMMAAKEQNISILSYLANHFNAPIIAWMAPIIAMIAITKSFLGHYLGAREGFNIIAMIGAIQAMIGALKWFAR